MNTNIQPLCSNPCSITIAEQRLYLLFGLIKYKTINPPNMGIWELLFYFARLIETYNFQFTGKQLEKKYFIEKKNFLGLSVFFLIQQSALPPKRCGHPCFGGSLHNNFQQNEVFFSVIWSVMYTRTGCQGVENVTF